MSEEFTREDLEKIIQDLTTNDLDLDLNMLGPSKEFIKSSKTLDEKIDNYNSIVQDSIFWASRQNYLEMLQSFLLKKIDVDTFISKYFQLRTKNIIRADELCLIIEDQILPIPDFYYTSKATDFSRTINDLYLKIDLYDKYIDDSDWNEIVYSESKLRSVIQEKFIPRFQRSCDLNDSFFSQ